MSDYNFIRINDLAYDKQTIVNRCGDLGYKFVEHFDKIYNNSSDEALDHWIGELKGWFNQVSKLKFKYNKKLISDEQLIDWFFTYGSDFDMFFGNNIKEQKDYENFCYDLLKTKDVEQSLKNIKII